MPAWYEQKKELVGARLKDRDGVAFARFQIAAVECPVLGSPGVGHLCSVCHRDGSPDRKSDLAGAKLLSRNVMAVPLEDADPDSDEMVPDVPAARTIRGEQEAPRTRPVRICCCPLGHPDPRWHWCASPVLLIVAMPFTVWGRVPVRQSLPVPLTPGTPREGPGGILSLVSGDLPLTYDANGAPGDPGLTLTAYSPQAGAPDEDGLRLLARWAP
jgi:hypothetical protein